MTNECPIYGVILNKKDIEDLLNGGEICLNYKDNDGNDEAEVCISLREE